MTEFFAGDKVRVELPRGYSKRGVLGISVLYTTSGEAKFDGAVGTVTEINPLGPYSVHQYLVDFRGHDNSRLGIPWQANWFREEWLTLVERPATAPNTPPDNDARRTEPAGSSTTSLATASEGGERGQAIGAVEAVADRGDPPPSQAGSEVAHSTESLTASAERSDPSSLLANAVPRQPAASASSPSHPATSIPPGSDQSHPRQEFDPRVVELTSLLDCPPGRPVKGNPVTNVFHMPGHTSYDATAPDICFATAEEAAAAGFQSSHASGHIESGWFASPGQWKETGFLTTHDAELDDLIPGEATYVAEIEMFAYTPVTTWSGLMTSIDPVDVRVEDPGDDISRAGHPMFTATTPAPILPVEHQALFDQGVSGIPAREGPPRDDRDLEPIGFTEVMAGRTKGAVSAGAAAGAVGVDFERPEGMDSTFDRVRESTRTHPRRSPATGATSDPPRE